jgi:hypothetical protein
MKLRKGAFVSAFVCWPEIKRCLGSIEDLVDIIQVLYGPYTGYNGKELGQEGGVIQDYCNRMSGDCEFKMCHVMPEVEKRGLAVEFAKEQNLDFLLIIDSDEYIDRKKLRYIDNFDNELEWYTKSKYKEYNLVGVDVEQNIDSWEARPRLWYKPKFVYYNNTHYYLKSSNPLCPYNLEPSAKHYKTHPPQYVLKNLRIKGDTSLRRPEVSAVHEHYLGLLRGSDQVGETLPNTHFILNE